MTEPAVLVSSPYRLTPAAYFRVAAGEKLPFAAGVAMAVVLVALAIGLVYDLRLVMVALILLFLVAPLVVAYIYYSKLLTREAHEALARKHVEIQSGQSITEHIHAVRHDEETVPTVISDEGGAGDKDAIVQSNKWMWTELKAIREHGKLIVITFTTTSRTVIVPRASFDNQSELDTLIYTRSAEKY